MEERKRWAAGTIAFGVFTLSQATHKSTSFGSIPKTTRRTNAGRAFTTSPTDIDGGTRALGLA
eukprot:1058932-Pelagomonas_calceolata.AAC.3